MRLLSITNNTWDKLYYKLASKVDDKGYSEIIGANYIINPKTDCIMTINSSLFEPKKALCMLDWYLNGLRSDMTILDCFSEYNRCIDANHASFNSNYGYYAFKKKLLDVCVSRLRENPATRQAMFCINNNKAMSDNSIDKLCTNTIQFFLRDIGKKELALEMVVQMRSSNFITLLPYDAFMFSVFYAYVLHNYNIYRAVRACPGKIRMQVASLHLYTKDVENIKIYNILGRIDNDILNIKANDATWLNDLKRNLRKAINKRENAKFT